MKKIFLGDIPPAVTVNDITEVFDDYGTIVDAQRLNDPTGAPYGIVEYTTDDSAERAIEERNGSTTWGVTIVVTEYNV